MLKQCLISLLILLPHFVSSQKLIIPELEFSDLNHPTFLIDGYDIYNNPSIVISKDINGKRVSELRVKRNNLWSTIPFRYKSQDFEPGQFNQVNSTIIVRANDSIYFLTSNFEWVPISFKKSSGEIININALNSSGHSVAIGLGKGETAICKNIRPGENTCLTFFIPDLPLWSNDEAHHHLPRERKWGGIIGVKNGYLVTATEKYSEGSNIVVKSNLFHIDDSDINNIKFKQLGPFADFVIYFIWQTDNKLIFKALYNVVERERQVSDLFFVLDLDSYKWKTFDSPLGLYNSNPPVRNASNNDFIVLYHKRDLYALSYINYSFLSLTRHLYNEMFNSDTGNQLNNKSVISGNYCANKDFIYIAQSSFDNKTLNIYSIKKKVISDHLNSK